FAPGLVGLYLGHTLRLLVAHRHLVLRRFSSGFGLQTVVHVVLARLAFELLFGRLRLVGRHLVLLRVRRFGLGRFGVRRLGVSRESGAAGKQTRQRQSDKSFHRGGSPGVAVLSGRGRWCFRGQSTASITRQATISTTLAGGLWHISLPHRSINAGCLEL